MIIGDYFFAKQGEKIEFMKVFNNPNYDEEMSVDLNLKLDENMRILRLMQTEKPNLVQVVF